MKVRVVVANENEANFLDTFGINTPLKTVKKLEDPKARMHDRDLETDRAGSRVNSGAPGRHGVDGERSTNKQEQIRFARQIADEIDQGRSNHDFDRLVIIAGPKMLGMIREALPDSNREFIAAEISKDLIQMDAQTIGTYIPQEAFYDTRASSPS
jgi:protein required for attachment to host cells